MHGDDNNQEGDSRSQPSLLSDKKGEGVPSSSCQNKPPQHFVAFLCFGQKEESDGNSE